MTGTRPGLSGLVWHALPVAICLHLVVGHSEATPASGAEATVEAYFLKADSLTATGAFDSALAPLQAAVDHARATFGTDDSVTARAYGRLAQWYFEMSRYEEADTAFRIAHSIILEQFGSESREAADSYYDLGDVLGSLDSLDEAVLYLEKAVTTLERLYAPESPEIIPPLLLLGNYESRRDSLDAAQRHLQRALAIIDGTEGSDSPWLIEANVYLHELGDKTDPSTSHMYLQTAVRVGALHPEFNPFYYARALWYLAQYYAYVREDLSVAEQLYKHSAEVLEGRHGYHHLELAYVMMGLSSVYRSTGDLVAALEHAEHARGILRQFPTLDRTTLGDLENSLGSMRSAQGRFEDAKEHYRAAIAYQSGSDANARQNQIINLVSLASAYSSAKDHDSAVVLLQMALDSIDAAPLIEPYITMKTLVQLGAEYFDTGQPALADSQYHQALAICAHEFGEESPQYYGILRFIADDYRQLGRHAEAEDLWKRCLRIDSLDFPAHHPNIPVDHLSLGAIYASTGRYELGVEHFLRAVRLRHEFISRVFTYSSEESKLGYLRQYRVIVEPLFSLALESGLEGAREAAFEMLLKGKGILIDALASERRFIVCQDDDPYADQLMDRHSSICESIARLTLAPTGRASLEQLDSLYGVKESVESEVSRFCAARPEFSSGDPLNVSAVRAAMPEDAVLIDFVKYRPYDFERTGRDSERFGPTHYLAFVIDRAGRLDMVDLGESDRVDDLVRKLRTDIAESRADALSSSGRWSETAIQRTGQELYAALLEPLMTSIGARKTLIVAPDGALNLLPFEILCDTAGLYVLENFQFNYVSTSRDIMDFGQEHSTPDEVLLVGDPDFESPSASQWGTASIDSGDAFLSTVVPDYVQIAVPCLLNEYPPLPYTRNEIDAIASACASDPGIRTRSVSGPAASEEMLRSLPGVPSVVHLATHGFVCDAPGTASGRDATANPLLKSGLILAGANASIQAGSWRGSGDDGILTALEASALNLYPADLITLSGCETGLGEVTDGEGVAGLRRAFHMAGGRSVLMSLWAVPDRETSSFMAQFYTHWLSGLSKQDALRRARLDALSTSRDRYGHTHPYAWAGFVLFGDPN